MSREGQRRLIHYSSKPLRKVRAEGQNKNNAACYKPCGLWFSVEGEADWLSWCEAEGFGAPFTCATEIVLKKDANVLVLSTPEDIDRFTETWSTLAWVGVSGHNYREIDWHSVAATYDGLIISPYIYERRFTDHTFWYYGWDCASGCIWNPDAIESLKAVDPPVRKKREDEAA